MRSIEWHIPELPTFFSFWDTTPKSGQNHPCVPLLHIWRSVTTKLIFFSGKLWTNPLHNWILYNFISMQFCRICHTEGAATFQIRRLWKLNFFSLSLFDFSTFDFLTYLDFWFLTSTFDFFDFWHRPHRSFWAHENLLVFVSLILRLTKLLALFWSYVFFILFLPKVKPC